MKQLFLVLALICAACTQGKSNQNQPRVAGEGGGGGGQPLGFKFSECPNTVRLWKNDKQQEVKFSRGNGFMTVNDPELAAQNFVVDGRIYPLDEKNTYIGVCSGGVLSIGIHSIIEGQEAPLSVFYGVDVNDDKKMTKQVTEKDVVTKKTKLVALEEKL
jgi:hypothetical protein